MRISDWSSDVCSSDLVADAVGGSVIRLGHDTRTRLNPLARGPRRTGASDEQHEQMVRHRRIATLISLIEMALGGKALTAPDHAYIHPALARAIPAPHHHPTPRTGTAQVHRNRVV